MKQLRNRVQPFHSNEGHLQKRDRDLLILVIAEIIIYIITTTPFSIVNIEVMITQFIFPVKSLPLIQIEVFALNIAILLLFVFSGIPFYTYITASTSFRRELKQLIRNSYHKVQKLLYFELDHSTSQ